MGEEKVLLTALRPYFTASLALTTAGVIAVTPVPTQLPVLALANPAVELVNGDSLLNVPLNLFQAFFNVPYNEINAINTFAQSMVYSGPWFVGSPTNVWGEDPGDVAHFQGIAQMSVPFPVLSGAGHEDDLTFPGLGQQLALMLNAEIPADPTCESLDCLPMMPTSPITGFTWLDQPMWTLMIATGIQKFPLIDNWFQVPFSDMLNGNSYFFNPTWPSLQDSGLAHDQYNFIGTITPQQVMDNHPEIQTEHPEVWTDLQQMVDDGNVRDLMPWAGMSYQMDFQTPFDNFYQSLQEPFDPGDFHLPSLEDIGRAFQSLLASLLLAFNPFVPGGLACPGPCVAFGDNPGPDGIGVMAGTNGIPLYYTLVKAVSDLWPGNKTLETWLDDYANGTANVSTPDIMAYEAHLWQLQNTVTDYTNPLPPDPAIDTSGSLPTLDDYHNLLGDYLYNIALNIGFLGPYNPQGLYDTIFDITPYVPATEAVTDGANAADAATDLLAAAG